MNEQRKRVRSDNLRKRLSNLERAHGDDRRKLNEIYDTFNVRDNTSSLLKDWIGKVVEVKKDDQITVGVLKFVDKFNFGIQIEGESEPAVFPKSNVDRIKRVSSG